MAGLTPRQLRIRAALIVVAFGLTLSLIILAFAWVGSAEWLVLVLLLIDIPIYALIALVDWAARRRT